MKEKKYLIKYEIGIIIFCAIFALANIEKVSAGLGENTSGWAWGGGVELDGSEPWDGTDTNFGWISMNNMSLGAGGIFPYGVNIPALTCTAGVDCNLTGYAWSENVGWIDFESQNHCSTTTNDATHYKSKSCTDPDGGAGGVFRNGNNLIGWARIVGTAQESAIGTTGNSGGWEGWIKLSGITKNNDPYGVSIAPSGTEFEPNSYAWSEELGWIFFGGSEYINILPPPEINSFTANPDLINVQDHPDWSDDPGTEVTLTWVTSGNTNCELKSTSLEDELLVGKFPVTGINKTGSQIIHQKDANVTYTFSCDSVGLPATAQVQTVCYATSCVSEKCVIDSTKPHTGVQMAEDCQMVADYECSGDCGCVDTSKKPGQWIEISPSD